MSSEDKTLVVGMGSPHGDDQAGWRVIDSLSSRVLSNVNLRKASVPHDFIDWLNDCDVLHLVDGCEVDEFESIVDRLDIVMSPMGVRMQQSSSGLIAASAGCLVSSLQLRSHSSHQIDVISVLRLANQLNALPEHVVLWAVSGKRFDPNDALSAGCEAAVADCVDRISAELCGA